MISLDDFQNLCRNAGGNIFILSFRVCLALGPAVLGLEASQQRGQLAFQCSPSPMCEVTQISCWSVSTCTSSDTSLFEVLKRPCISMRMLSASTQGTGELIRTPERQLQIAWQ